MLFVPLRMLVGEEYQKAESIHSALCLEDSENESFLPGHLMDKSAKKHVSNRSKGM